MSTIEITISERDIDLILSAISYQHWNDRELSNEDRDYLDGFYQALESLVSVES
jgi:hypothetical protein